jgi:hypothetical protein
MSAALVAGEPGAGHVLGHPALLELAHFGAASEPRGHKPIPVPSAVDLCVFREIKRPETNEIALPPSDPLKAVLAGEADVETQVALSVRFVLLQPLLQVRLVFDNRYVIWHPDEAEKPIVDIGEGQTEADGPIFVLDWLALHDEQAKQYAPEIEEEQ